ncbi:MAG: hypothetical protein NZ959_01585 [Armatimonadetes bacterium]|nr:hypothetical protein [Armatimonadota bacterium]MDW8121352.1 hypothetical protein [Armatimonadota bacterium]
MKEGTSGQLQAILNAIHRNLDEKEQIREKALVLARDLIRSSSLLIKHLHRNEGGQAERVRDEIKEKVKELRQRLLGQQELWLSGFVQDALKEVAEALILFALMRGEKVPAPDEIGCDDVPYLNGLAEAMSELRRAVLDSLRQDQLQRAEQYLNLMDDVFFMLVRFDHANALTQGLRHRVDSLRAVLERTRSDVTIAFQYSKMTAHTGEPKPNP